MVLVPGQAHGESKHPVLSRKDPAKELWDGNRGSRRRRAVLAPMMRFLISDLDDILPGLPGRPGVLRWIRPGAGGARVRLVSQAAIVRRAGAWLIEFRTTTTLHEMRLCKSRAEVAVMRRAGACRRQAHT